MCTYLVEEHLYKGRVAAGLQAPARELTGRIAWLSARKGTLPAEQRIVLERAGLIDPESIEDYIIHDGYEALGKALTEMTPAEVIAELEKSGLRGRGGAGFPTGHQVELRCARPLDTTKYVICNADESEPGTFKDRVDPGRRPAQHHRSHDHRRLTPSAPTKATSTFAANTRWPRSASPRPSTRPARWASWARTSLAPASTSTSTSTAGAGAYICGEETALIESIEGKRGEPRARPPYPTTNGLWGKPTLVNNVETLANVPPILRNGAAWYRSFGTPTSPGTKVYTILGNVNVTGLIEVPMGITLREVIAIYAKGMKNGATFKLAQTGGSSGSIIPASLQDTPMDFDSFTKAGVSLGSGALLICDEDTCVVDLAQGPAELLPQ